MAKIIGIDGKTVSEEPAEPKAKTPAVQNYKFHLGDGSSFSRVGVLGINPLFLSVQDPKTEDILDVVPIDSIYRVEVIAGAQ